MISHYRQTEALVVAHAQKRRCRATSLSGRSSGSCPRTEAQVPGNQPVRKVGC
ncbi:hypothetical protein J6590_011568 [Homalodisca vitripennis]|nr:hypothetical protein J6590_011566 [Homalodisca vitripennis]KAG8268957.1 hypothetical protein J6590_011568 [Homalodisca vitripennis]